MTTRTRRIGGVVAAVVLVAGALVTAAPAQAATTPGFIATPNGLVGVSQSILIKAPNAAGQVVAVQAALGPAVTALQTTIGSNGIGQLTWTPGGAGSWAITGTGTIASLSTTVTVAPMPTYTVILAPNHLQQGSADNQIVAAAIAPIGTLAPQGNVTFGVPNGITLGSAPLAGNFSPNISYATLSWNPGFSGALPVQATYQPASGGQLTSTSPIAQPNISSAFAPLVARWPSTLYQGQPTLVQGVLGAGQGAGTVAFSFSTGGGSGSVPTQNGVASYQWTPQVAGVQTITVQYTGFNPGFSGSVTQVVNVLPARPIDNITVTSPAQGTWSQGQPETMTSNATITLSGTSQSGTPVLFSEVGPCYIDGAVLASLGTGTCQVTAFSPGNAQLQPGSETYIVNVTAPPAKPKPRPNRNRR